MERTESINTPDYPVADWLINPDVSAVSTVARKYWKVSGSSVVEMSQAEKDVVDAIVAPVGQTVHLASPDNSVWLISIDDAGIISGAKV